MRRACISGVMKNGRWDINCKRKQLSVLLGYDDTEVEYGTLEETSHLDNPTSRGADQPRNFIELSDGYFKPKNLEFGWNHQGGKGS